MDSATIPEWFASRGYTTGAFSTNPYTGAHTAFSRGFDDYEDFMEDGEGFLMKKAAHFPVLSEMKHVVTLVRGDRASKPWTDYYDRIVEWVQTAEEPYFLWLFLLDTHTPYLADATYRAENDIGRLAMLYHNWRLWMGKKWGPTQNHSGMNREKLVDLYDATIRSVDDFLATLSRDIRDTDPAMVIHADHGEAFGEHGTYGHNAQLYEENLHVPLVVHGSEIRDSMKRPVSLADLPVVLRNVATDSDSLPDELGSGPILAKTVDAEQFSLRGPTWKYICRTSPDDGTIHEERMYDLAHDPDEQNPTDGASNLMTACRRVIPHRLSHERELNTVVDSVDVLKGDLA
jgi:arylsulfatase